MKKVKHLTANPDGNALVREQCVERLVEDGQRRFNDCHFAVEQKEVVFGLEIS